MTPTEMAAVDAEAPEPTDVLIERAGQATARAAIGLLGDLGRTTYGARVAVLAGKGNNGADGRHAVRHLERRGARCTVFGRRGWPAHRGAGRRCGRRLRPGDRRLLRHRPAGPVRSG